MASSRRRSAVVLVCLFYFMFFTTKCTVRSSGRLKTEAFRPVKGRDESTYEYETFYKELPVDHFGYTMSEKFKLRYLVADQYWDSNNGPIFFYTGNEGDITWFAEATGFMWDIAPEFKAMVVFAEHRYYGESLPFGEESYKDAAHLGYLSTEQALADFAELIVYIKQNTSGAANSPVVAFGGSYGGMLAAWLRMKYPHVVVGSLASSAPIWAYNNLVGCEYFYQIVTKDYTDSSPVCSANIRKSWDVISQFGKDESGREFLSQTLRLCSAIVSETQVTTVKDWLNAIWTYTAMTDYPYPADFLEPLPAWPVDVICSHLGEADLSDEELVARVADGVNVYLNSTGNHECFNTSEYFTSSLEDTPWEFQSCTEEVMPLCSNGVTDMFEPYIWDLDAYAAYCEKMFDAPLRPNWALIEYGGKNITAASNIIFSNGDLDPWSGGGVLESLSPTLVAIIIKDGAHHLDLRAANPDDPQSVIDAREQEKAIIKNWIQQDGVTAREALLEDNKIAVSQIADDKSTSPIGGTNVASTLLIACVGVAVAAVGLFLMVSAIRKKKGQKENADKNPVVYDTCISMTTNEEKCPLIVE